MLWNILIWLADTFDATMLAVILLCGLWSYWMVAPALAERQLGREARVARAGGLIYLGAAVSIFVALRIARLFLPL